MAASARLAAACSAQGVGHAFLHDSDTAWQASSSFIEARPGLLQGLGARLSCMLVSAGNQDLAGCQIWHVKLSSVTVIQQSDDCIDDAMGNAATRPYYPLTSMTRRSGTRHTLHSKKSIADQEMLACHVHTHSMLSAWMFNLSAVTGQQQTSEQTTSGTLVRSCARLPAMIGHALHGKQKLTSRGLAVTTVSPDALLRDGSRVSLRECRRCRNKRSCLSTGVPSICCNRAATPTMSFLQQLTP